jgi:hypothetical protein
VGAVIHGDCDLPAASNTGSQASEDDVELYGDPNLVIRDVASIRACL